MPEAKLNLLTNAFPAPGATESGLKRPRRDRKVAGFGGAGHVGIARRVQRNSNAPIAVAAAEVGGIDQRRTAAVQLADERIGVTAVGSLKGPRRGRKVAGIRAAGEVGITRRVSAQFHGHYRCRCRRGRWSTPTPSQRCSACSRTHRSTAGPETGLKRPRRGREVTGRGVAGDVGIARRVQRNSIALIECCCRRGRWNKPAPSRGCSACSRTHSNRDAAAEVV